jgi:Na+-transporting methylmalonyl-CoA/oxaloacetate decarboxylase gamma subunit
MNSFVSSGYGVILLIWGVAFELVGTGIVLLVNRAIRSEERQEEVTESVPPPETNQLEQPPAEERERELVGSGRRS